MSNAHDFVQVPFPDPEKVQMQHRNEIIISTYFTMKPGCQNKFVAADRILLKSFPSYIFSIERQSYLDQKLKQVLHVMPRQFYDPKKFDYDCSHEFADCKAKEDWLTQLPLDQQVLVSYSKARSVGCPHYIRGCEYSCVTCGKFYGCRLCHDDEVDDHQFDRYVTDTIRCRYCATVQKFGQKCETCKVEFGWYICFTCKMICGLGEDAKPNYHCEGCKICMVGRRQYSKHCDACKSCFNVDYFDQHKCCKVSGECCVCMDDMEKTIYGRIVPNCGHIMHSHCYQTLLQKQNYKCPLCKKFLPVHDDSKRIIDFQEKVYDRIFIPQEYEGYYVKVKCNDCQQEATQHFHPYKYFCGECKNFNTDVIGDSSVGEFLKSVIERVPWKTPLHSIRKDIDIFVLKTFREAICKQFNVSEDGEILTNFYKYIDLVPDTVENINTIVETANKTFTDNLEDFKITILNVKHNIPDELEQDDRHD
ncbi:RING finger and CHY zinc finger domain-containing protein [Spironucleus salmonicida]|uniref:RING finger and CHY zinc finger domain-containing protein n=1 Tax=Spironucleus salmonicida TaxID=348837 RepID=V6LDF4_9EUKA|nr:RING finger and CHY zinc finger domain-containing protein [Spironucleus salmonicida]|eukprot:EST41691.1 RING finger and CHY zinc finger domain-containing protein [Spironucleus salmonicida]